MTRRLSAKQDVYRCCSCVSHGGSKGWLCRGTAASSCKKSEPRAVSYAVHKPLNAVNADGGLYMATPLDPVFLLLPILEAAAAQVSCNTACDNHFPWQWKNGFGASAAVHQQQKQAAAPASAVSMKGIVCGVHVATAACSGANDTSNWRPCTCSCSALTAVATWSAIIRRKRGSVHMLVAVSAPAAGASTSACCRACFGSWGRRWTQQSSQGCATWRQLSWRRPLRACATRRRPATTRSCGSVRRRCACRGLHKQVQSNPNLLAGGVLGYEYANKWNIFEGHCKGNMQCQICLWHVCLPEVVLRTCWLCFQRGVEGICLHTPHMVQPGEERSGRFLQLAS